LDERTLGQVEAGASEGELGNSWRLLGDYDICDYTPTISMAVMFISFEHKHKLNEKVGGE
jgi:hypothetical protein